MSIFKRLLKFIVPPQEEQENTMVLMGTVVSTKPEPKKKSHFTIEYYPATNAYYPKYKNWYLKKSIFTGIVELKEPFLFGYADSFSTEAQADRLIELFKEQQLKENVKVIQK